MSAIVDAEHINKGEYIEDHSSRWLLRMGFFIAMAMSSKLDGLASALLFTALFDQLLNWFRNKPFWYLGTVAKWDIFFSKRKWLYITVKIICLITAITLFLI
jgi:hypothetical protein